MTIGRSSRKNKAPRSPPFLDKANGFYGRLDEMGGDDVQVEVKSVEGQMGTSTISTGGENRPNQDNMMVPGWMEEDDHATDFNQGMMDDDGAALLQRKPSRLSRRWSRKSSRKAKFDKSSSRKESTETDNKEMPPVAITLETTSVREPEAKPVHFSVREHVDDQVLISGKELEDARKEKKMKDRLNEESEAVKRNSLQNYRRAVDRAFRRGWETFITNLYSVTLTPISSTSTSASPSVKSNMNRNCALAESR